MINGVLIITLGIVKAKVKTCIMLIGMNRINFSTFHFSKGSWYSVWLWKKRGQRFLSYFETFFYRWLGLNQFSECWNILEKTLPFLVCWSVEVCCLKCKQKILINSSTSTFKVLAMPQRPKLRSEQLSGWEYLLCFSHLLCKEFTQL